MNLLKFTAPVLILIVIATGCTTWEDFTTYFNTYYNAQRLMAESEDEFDFQDEKKRVNPRLFLPKSSIFVEENEKAGTPQFMRDFVISQQKLQPVEVKLDSIEIKGSKILANHSKSKYIEGILYLMAKSYFYQSAWLNSQVKTSELIDRFPDGEFSPDAHLLMAKNYLVQRKFYEGNLLLSRCVDISWQKQRYDILSEAFRLQAELALDQGDEKGALRPYLQAIAQSGDNKLRAKWQVDMAALFFRLEKFDRAEKEFAKVHDYSPDYLAAFEADLYRASCLSRLGRFTEANELLEDLEGDGKNEEWMAYVVAEKINMYRLQKNKAERAKAEAYADSAFIGSPAMMGAYFEMGMDLFRQKDYIAARTYFARSKASRSPVYESSQKLFYLINQWDQKKNLVIPELAKISEGKSIPDSTAPMFAMNLFELGRVHEQLGNPDSAAQYYKLAVEICPRSDERAARYIYAYSRMFRESDPYRADSLLDVIAENYPLTEYGKEARMKLGYTEAFVIDTVADLYLSGDRLRKFGDYYFAIKQFTKIYENYPKSDFAPKSIYSIGWIYEKNLQKPDSALYFYQMLLSKYPLTEYAQDVKLSVNYLKAVRSGNIPDSLKPKVVSREAAPLKGPDSKFKPVEEDNKAKKKEKDKNLTPDNIFKAPGDFIKGAEDALKNPLNVIKDFKLPDNPLNLLKPKNENQNSPDSTKIEGNKPD